MPSPRRRVSKLQRCEGEECVKMQKVQPDHFVRRRRIDTAVERNRNLPPISGRFEQTQRGMLGESTTQRWGELHPSYATLTLWHEAAGNSEAKHVVAPLRTAIGRSFNLLARSRQSRSCKSPLKTYNMTKLEEVDANIPHRNIFLKFEGVENTVVLTAMTADVFHQWMEYLNLYEAAPENDRENTAQLHWSELCTN
eukprot:TRINITY_DN20136_c0_g1_i1.p1 TRINITY_DN20136_c0_g1~~TRINITY_DN20136_c0_g1_i1.p1  ORF type:complete len:220 (-),score=24.22 TRINITY_DN20136_c0_g1_i1:490-1077(-)